MAKEKKVRIVQTKGKKKKAIARLRIKKGGSSIKINKAPIELFRPKNARDVLLEPVIICKETLGKDCLEGLDIDINVKGGGVMARAYASRTALGKALVAWTKSNALREAYLNYDRSLLIDDVRVREPKKYLRKGARARPTKSYR